MASPTLADTRGTIALDDARALTTRRTEQDVYDPRGLLGGAESIAMYLLVLLPISPLMLRGWRSARGQTE